MTFIKKLTLLATLLTSTMIIQSANASSRLALKCQAYIPHAILDIVVTSDRKAGYSLDMKFYNEGLDQTFEGVLKMSLLQANQFNSFGVLNDKTDLQNGKIDGVSVFGSLIPSSDGIYVFSIYAKWDHRIEYGYGNIITCVEKSAVSQ